ncbi:hypothetical protein RFI_15548 [Reticulomyxa filosa]|uniref:3'-5' exonuclease domain-containing protein n=1 Tax=Reticulomyxa filosa TaxID=46433 RepID=X6N5U3_RETFI|nr:hypothetical protein RFI_15548 [Reticulomyxa filosa]|eukprot:ETO21660.1 hypothetical protein RFI_15548 [Reticulomyxa filosa]
MVATNLTLPNTPLHCQTLQISTCELSCIFDLQAIYVDDLLLHEFDALLCFIFAKSKAIKIGMSFSGDLRALKNQMPHLQAFHSITPYLELADCLHFIQNDEFLQKSVFLMIHKQTRGPPQKKFREGGLAKLVSWVLDRKLDKDEQLSNWSLRPLRSSQLKYGALDALCECWLYQELWRWSEQSIFPPIDSFLKKLQH